MLIFRRHIMRNAAIPVMTASGLAVAGLVAGAIVVESAFAIDGIGSLLVKSVAAKDYAVVVAIAVLIVGIFILITTTIDVVQTLLDPQARAVGKR
jgi:peptide/nickel transport system permease protein